MALQLLLWLKKKFWSLVVVTISSFSRLGIIAPNVVSVLVEQT
jgi:ABC-type enterochelin transport system permease subunit